jgi:predicted NUDIX family NTP pyrophosphohydrolase
LRHGFRWKTWFVKSGRAKKPLFSSVARREAAVSMPVMGRVSAGLLLFRRTPAGTEVLLVHPGGPLWAKRDLGAWSIPKGEVEEGEELQAAARREFAEELGFAPPGEFHSLGSIKQKGGKTVHAWAVEGDCDPARCRSNTFKMQWPPRSQTWVEFPEVDRADFFSLAAAREKINPAQLPLLEQLRNSLSSG